MQDIFLEYKTIIVFLHVISAVVWVGGMIAMRFAAHPSFMEIESPLKRLEHISKALKKLFESCTGSGPTSECPILEALEKESHL